MNKQTVSLTLVKAIEDKITLTSGEWAHAKFPTAGDAVLALDILERLGLEQDGLMKSRLASPVARMIVKIWFPYWFPGDVGLQGPGKSNGSADKALRMLKMEV